MRSEEYRNILNAAIDRMGELIRQRDKIEVELGKLQQFIPATANLLPDEERSHFITALSTLLKEHEIRTASLTKSIRKVLKKASGDWLTTAQVRDRLIEAGFDFSGYTASPLASVSTTLKRSKAEDVESRMIGGVTVYHWKRKK